MVEQSRLESEAGRDDESAEVRSWRKLQRVYRALGLDEDEKRVRERIAACELSELLGLKA